MGNTASSTAVVNNTQQAYISAVQNTSNKAVSSAINTGYITVQNTEGSVEISDVNVNQKASSMVSAQFANTNDASILQKVAASLDNTAQTAVSGIGVGNSAQSNSIINTYINTAMQISQSITNECGAIAQNDFRISVSGTTEDVKINNISVDQSAEAVTQCVTDNASTAIATQMQEVVAKNTATAVSKGLELPSLMGLLFIFLLPLLLLIGLPAIGMVVAKDLLVKLLPIILGFGLLALGIATLFTTTKAKIPNQSTFCEDTIAEVEEQKEKTKVFIKPFFFTCGIYGKGVNSCPQMFLPSNNVVVGNFSTFNQLLNTDTNQTGGSNACSFTIHPTLTNKLYGSISDAFNAFESTSDCVGLDALYDLNGNLRYIFYSKVDMACATALQYDMKDDAIQTWNGTSDTIQTNPWFPPLLCVVLNCVDGVPSNSDGEAKPYYIRISKQGFVYYYKNGAWVQVNSTTFWPSGKTPPDLNNILVYKGSPDKTPNLLSKDKHVDLDLTKPIAYIDISNISLTTTYAPSTSTSTASPTNYRRTKFEIYWNENPSLTTYPPGTATPSPENKMQGFVKISEVDCSIMNSDGVYAFEPNPLLKFMNRTWVKLYKVEEKLMTSDEQKAFKSGFTSPEQRDNYNICMDNEKLIQSGKNQKKAMVGGGIALIVIGTVVLLLGIIWVSQEKKSKKQQQTP